MSTSTFFTFVRECVNILAYAHVWVYVVLFDFLTRTDYKTWSSSKNQGISPLSARLRCIKRCTLASVASGDRRKSTTPIIKLPLAKASNHRRQQNLEELDVRKKKHANVRDKSSRPAARHFQRDARARLAFRDRVRNHHTLQTIWPFDSKNLYRNFGESNSLGYFFYGACSIRRLN